jgi:hypothetical protein
MFGSALRSQGTIADDCCGRREREHYVNDEGNQRMRALYDRVAMIQKRARKLFVVNLYGGLELT